MVPDVRWLVSPVEPTNWLVKLTVSLSRYCVKPRKGTRCATGCEGCVSIR